MKIRTNFVSNSSSSSFILHNWSDIKATAQDMIIYPQNFSSLSGLFNNNDDDDFEYLNNAWNYNYDELTDDMCFYTGMDNFDQKEWIYKVWEYFTLENEPNIT